MIRRRPPADPLVRDLVVAAQRSAVSRRQLLGGVGLGLGATALTACAPPPPPATAQALKLPTDVSTTDKVVRWANWTAYLDYDEETKQYPSLQGFIERTGIELSRRGETLTVQEFAQLADAITLAQDPASASKTRAPNRERQL